jgi:hypothetical protein
MFFRSLEPEREDSEYDMATGQIGNFFSSRCLSDLTFSQEAEYR